MAEDCLPEHVIFRILERLPIKSLIRFTSVSKRWRFIISSDPIFAKSHFHIASHHQTLTGRLLLSDGRGSQFESRDLETPSSFRDKSSVRNLRCPLKQPIRQRGGDVCALCSCNGLVLATLLAQQNRMYIWNPSTSFFKQLPALPSKFHSLRFYGFGYVSATDSYKVIAKRRLDPRTEEDDGSALIFSSKPNIWKRIESPLFSKMAYKGALVNEALHWLSYRDVVIIAFDLAKEELRTMPLPEHNNVENFGYLGAFGSCLCVYDEAYIKSGSVDLWVMRDYGVADSWTKMFRLKVSDRPEDINYLKPILVTETSTFLLKGTFDSGRKLECKLIRSGHENEQLETYMLSKQIDNMLAYEESLLRPGNYNKRTCPIELAKKARNASEARNNGEQGRVNLNEDNQGPHTVNVCVQNQGSSSVDVQVKTKETRAKEQVKRAPNRSGKVGALSAVAQTSLTVQATLKPVQSSSPESSTQPQSSRNTVYPKSRVDPVTGWSQRSKTGAIKCNKTPEKPNGPKQLSRPTAETSDLKQQPNRDL
ncbi:putative F-box domain, galactose oxidase/kelch, beta-propeller, F-box associated interaction [Rosa chinensis]|uniref:Putative F-box domain, galactose oxidase/kelch, beta-propeller, F-box associated interaction n=1 Tax=Rosa chinensis TaxID=74649 RepID=A0A2P6QHC9_ROSCH|nr:F-box protein CPR1 [Rosa chinensis]PRQ33581.1 putative F-box domain, galactose oxidase/kelch, beta-propeller, F-box associated interaction [Rosa chinensis]